MDWNCCIRQSDPFPKGQKQCPHQVRWPGPYSATCPCSRCNTDTRSKAGRSHHPGIWWRTGRDWLWLGGQWRGGLPRRGLSWKCATSPEVACGQANTLFLRNRRFFGKCLGSGLAGDKGSGLAVVPGGQRDG